MTALEGWDWGGHAAYGWSEAGREERLSLAMSQAAVHRHSTAIGDFDGNGTDDLTIHGFPVGGEPDQGRPDLGGRPDWPSGLADIDEAAHAVWGGVIPGDMFSEEFEDGDVDRHGLVDIVTHAPYDVGGYGGRSGWLFVLPGRADGFPTDDEPDAVRSSESRHE